MKGFSEIDRIAAQKCIGIVNRHIPLNGSEKRLLVVIVNEIQLAFDLEGVFKPELLVNDNVKAPEAPEVWIW